MANRKYSPDCLIHLFQRQKIALLEELKAELGTPVDMTVFRKLRELAYRTSYSHNGRYYTVDGIPEFDETGLWSFRSVWFSKHGTLLATAEACVSESEAGYLAGELEAILHVEVKDAPSEVGPRGARSQGGCRWQVPVLFQGPSRESETGARAPHL